MAEAFITLEQAGVLRKTTAAHANCAASHMPRWKRSFAK